MVEGSRQSGWQLLGRTVRGAAHVRRDLPNQDAIAWTAGQDGSAPWILAVSDGHGSARSFRSELGSQIAVRVLQKLLTEFAGETRRELPLEWIENHARGFLARELDYRWKRQILDHLSDHPFSEDETEMLFVHRKADHGQEGILNPFLAYGATALGVLATDRYLLHLQLGDGDILHVAANGEVSRPFKPDERLLGNETTSLCATKAYKDVRLHVQAEPDENLELILVSTDGYANSFRTDDEFRQVGPDLLNLIRNEGPEAVDQDLSEWLNETSQQGSGDDITLGILSRCAAPEVKPELNEDAPPVSLNPVNET